MKLSRKQIREAAETLPIQAILGKTVSDGLTTKQKKFAREVAKGATKADAYRSAYNVTSKYTMASKPYELVRDERIQREIQAYTLALEAAKHRTPAHLRELVIHQLTKHAIDDDIPPAQRLKALHLLGQITEVAAFTERKEVRNITSSEDARNKVMSELRSILSAGADDANIIERDADTLLAELAGEETHRTGTPPDAASESRLDKHTIPHQQISPTPLDPETPPGESV